MSEKLNVLIIGGDNRYLEVINILLERGLNVYVTGFDNVSFDAENITKWRLDEIEFEKIDAILLAISGTDLEGRISTAFSDEPLFLTKEMISNTKKHCIICTGVINRYLEEVCSERTLIDLYARDDVAIYNAIPTSEGILMKAMQETDYTVHNANVIVLGFGRIGFTVAHLFAAVGANVTVAVRNPADIARIKQLKLSAIYLDDLEKEVGRTNIIINTIPHLLVNEDVIAQMKGDTLIIDIATKPGGVDFKAAELRGIKAIHYLGIPGDVAPKTGGIIMANAFLDVIDHL